MVKSIRLKVLLLSAVLIFALVGALLGCMKIPVLADEAISWNRLLSSDTVPLSFDEKIVIEETFSFLEGRKKPLSQVNFPKDDVERLVLLSVSDGKKSCTTSYGRGAGVLGALKDAAKRLKEKGHELQNVRWLKVNIVKNMELRRMASIKKPLPIEKGLEGLAFPGCDNCIFAPEDVLAKKIINDRGFLQPPALVLWGDVSAEDMVKTMLTTRMADYVAFQTRTAFWDGSKVQELYRGSPLYVNYGKIEIENAARLAAHYLVRVTRPDGKFIYIYDPIKNRSLGGYNMLRHAGTVFAMLQYYENTKDKDVLDAAKKAIKYMLSKVKTFKRDGKDMACLVEGDYVKLGGNGLAILSLVKYVEITGEKEYLPILYKMGEWILSVQDKSGRFVVHKQIFPDGEVTDFRSVYYPGEAIFALAAIGQLDKQEPEKWFEAAYRAARYIIKVRDGKKTDFELPHDHWLLYGLDEICRSGGYDKDGLLLKHSIRLAKAIDYAQHKNSYFPDWIGGFGENPRSAPAATRMEGLGAAYRMAKRAGMETEAENILNTLKLGGGFLLRIQIGPSWAMHLKKPYIAIGGVRKSLTDFDVRIDYVQHSLSALLALQEILR